MRQILVYICAFICINCVVLKIDADGYIDNGGDPTRQYFYFRTRANESSFKKLDIKLNSVLDRIERIDMEKNRNKAVELIKVECTNIQVIYKTLSSMPDGKSRDVRRWKIEDLFPYACGGRVDQN